MWLKTGTIVLAVITLGSINNVLDDDTLKEKQQTFINTNLYR